MLFDLRLRFRQFSTFLDGSRADVPRKCPVGVPFAWFTADEAYGQAKWLQAWLEEHGVSYVTAIRRSDTLTTDAGEQRAGALIAALSSRCWQRISAGAGAHGPREYHWARIPVRPGWKRDRGHWLLACREAGLPVRAAATLCSVCHQGSGGRHLVRSPVSVRRAWKWRSGWRSMSGI